MSGEATKKSPIMTIRERMAALHCARVAFFARTAIWNKAVWKAHPIASVMTSPIAMCREKTKPVKRAIMLTKIWPMNEHQNAVLSENREVRGQV